MIWPIVETVLAVLALLAAFVFGYILGQQRQLDEQAKVLRERLDVEAIHARKYH